MRRLLGVDIGGTKCAVVLGTDEPRVLERVSFPTEVERGPEHAIERILDAAARFARPSDRGDRAAAVGVSCGGPLDSARGLILSPPNLPGWDRIEIVSILKAATGLPVFLQNDADACALAEWRWGAGRGCRDMIFLTFGTGMGAGLILGGRLYSGASGMAGEVGHLRLASDGPIGYGKRGSFEGFCSGGGIAQLARAEVERRLARREAVGFCATSEEAARLTAREVVVAAEGGDPAALSILEVSATYLGRGLAILIDLFNPERIVIGSIFARAEGFFRARAEEVIREEALDRARAACAILPASLGEQIGDFGSLCVALEGLRGEAGPPPGDPP